MKTRITTSLLAMAGSVALLVTGCSTSNKGATGSDTQYGAGTGGGGPTPVYTGSDGSVSRTNPFGIADGSGITH
jgi:hypothetical protein